MGAVATSVPSVPCDKGLETGVDHRGMGLVACCLQVWPYAAYV